MTTQAQRFTHTATAVAAAALLVACGGGGSASAPAGSVDTTSPTLTITDDVSAATATGNVTFTFTFSEAVSGFTTEDVTVTGGTKGTFTMASDNRSATLVVAPTANSTGTINVSVPANAFLDMASNANTASASGSQDYNLTTPVYLSFDETPARLSNMGAYGGALPEVATAPAGASGKALKISKPAGTGNEVWGGTYFTVPRVPFTSAKKAITAKVYSSVPNAVIKLKVEVPNGASLEVAGTTVTAANTWTTVTWNFSAADLSANYTVLAVTPDATRTLDGAVYYIDQMDVADTPPSTAVTFASAFSGTNSTTAQGGGFGGYSGGNGDTWSCSNTCGGGLNDNAGRDRYYYYYNAPAGTTGLYAGVYVMAPNLTSLSGNVSGLNVSGKSKFNFTFGQNDEWFNSASDRNFGVLFTMSNVYSVGNGTNNCRIELWQVVTPTAAADTAYSINLSDFYVRQDCGTGLTAANVFGQQTVAQIDFKANAGSARFAAVNGRQEGANTTIAASGVYPTTLVVKGPLTFE